MLLAKYGGFFLLPVLLAGAAQAVPSGKLPPVLRPLTLRAGTVRLALPTTWHHHSLASAYSVDYFGPDWVTGCFVETKLAAVPATSFAALAQREIRSVKAKNPGMLVESIALDSVNGRLLIDYQGAYQGHACYFRQLRCIGPYQTLTVNFRGVDTPVYRRLVRDITATIQFKRQASR
jgi:hypothetical protein